MGSKKCSLNLGNVHGFFKNHGYEENHEVKKIFMSSKNMIDSKKC
jgi:hypothetical protein